MPTAKLLLHRVIKRAQQLGPAMGPNQYVPSTMQAAAPGAPVVPPTPMNGTRPVAADVPALPPVPTIPSLPGMPSSPITSPSASGATDLRPGAGAASFGKGGSAKTAMTGTEAAILGAGGTLGAGLGAVGGQALAKHLTSDVRAPTAGASIGAGVGAGLGMGAAALLQHLLAKKERKTAADFTGEAVDPAFAKQMAEQAARVKNQSVAASAKAQLAPLPHAVPLPPLKGTSPAAAVVPPVTAPSAATVAPAAGMPKTNSASCSYSAGTIAAEPKTNLKSPLPKAGLMGSKKTAANPIANGARTALDWLNEQAGTAGRAVGRMAEAHPRATGLTALGVGTGVGTAALAPVAKAVANSHPIDAMKALVGGPPAAPAKPEIDPLSWEGIKQKAGDVVGATGNYFKGFAQNPLKDAEGKGGWDAAHWGGAAAGAVGAGLLLNHLLSKRKNPEDQIEE